MKARWKSGADRSNKNLLEAQSLKGLTQNIKRTDRGPKQRALNYYVIRFDNRWGMTENADSSDELNGSMV